MSYSHLFSARHRVHVDLPGGPALCLHRLPWHGLAVRGRAVDGAAVPRPARGEAAPVPASWGQPLPLARGALPGTLVYNQRTI